jgi:ribonuclease H / adenosylcobalamin/alpha-ribazole phosphatase
MLIYFDGACEDVNPGGHMGWGIAVVDEETGTVQMTSSGYQEARPDTSNNVAEYLGCCMALRQAIAAAKAGTESITIRGDSKLVIEQLNGRWKAREGLYMAAMREAAALLQELRGLCSNVSLEWLPGSENIHADEASRAELEMRGIRRRERPSARPNAPRARQRPLAEPSPGPAARPDSPAAARGRRRGARRAAGTARGRPRNRG